MKKGGTELQVDVLRSVTGLTHDDLAVTESVRFANGKSYAVPAPDIMLKAKLANLSTHEQKERQDERHVRILTRCCALYLADIFTAMQAGRLSERETVERFVAVHRVTTSTKAQGLEKRYELGLSAAVPARASLDALKAFPRLRAFYDHQVETPPRHSN